MTCVIKQYTLCLRSRYSVHDNNIKRRLASHNTEIGSHTFDPPHHYCLFIMLFFIVIHFDTSPRRRTRTVLAYDVMIYLANSKAARQRGRRFLKHGQGEHEITRPQFQIRNVTSHVGVRIRAVLSALPFGIKAQSAVGAHKAHNSCTL